jgi:hypothetical protein
MRRLLMMAVSVGTRSTLLHGSENETEEQVNEFKGLLVSLTCDSLAIS